LKLKPALVYLESMSSAKSRAAVLNAPWPPRPARPRQLPTVNCVTWWFSTTMPGGVAVVLAPTQLAPEGTALAL